MIQIIKKSNLIFTQKLKVAQFNTHNLDAKDIPCDLQSDSWAGKISFCNTPLVSDTKLAEEQFKTLYGYEHAFSVSSGRMAEAIMAVSIIKPGSIVACNSLFPSTAYHIEMRGAGLQNIGLATSNLHDKKCAFKANIDLILLNKLLRNSKKKISCVWLECSNNALGGQTISLDNLKSVYQLCKPLEIPVILDATRLIENVIIYKTHPITQTSLTLPTLLKEFCKFTDACAMSITKDFKLNTGGFIATNSSILFDKMKANSLAFELHHCQPPLFCHNESYETCFENAIERIKLVTQLYDYLMTASIPMISTSGTHAIYIDAQKLLPQIASTQQPAKVLLNYLYQESGTRGSEHYYSVQQKQTNQSIVRLAIPILSYNFQELEPVISSLITLQEKPEKLRF